MSVLLLFVYLFLSLCYKPLLSSGSIPDVFTFSTLLNRFFCRTAWWSPHCRWGSYFSSTNRVPLWEDAYPLASGLSVGSHNSWWVRALKYNSVKWSKPGWGSGIFKGLGRVIFLLLVILAEVTNRVHSAGSSTDGFIRMPGPSATLSLSPSPLGGLPWVSLSRVTGFPDAERKSCQFS